MIGAPITVVLIIVELTGSYQYGLMALLSVTLCSTLTYQFFGLSFFDRQLLDRGIDLARGREHIHLSQIKISDVTLSDCLTFKKGASGADILKSMRKENTTESYIFYGLTICALTLTPLTAGADIFVSGLNALDRTHYASAYRSFKPLADEGIAEAQNNIGFLYQNGFGVKRNYNTAIKWYQRAADQSLAEAEHNLGVLNYWGWGVSQNFGIARRWFNKSAEKGLKESHYMIGLMFYKGEGTQASIPRASAHFFEAAKLGDPNSQYMLAHMITSGDVESNFKRKDERSSPFDFEFFGSQETDDLTASLALALLAMHNNQKSAAQLIEFIEYQLDEDDIALANTLFVTATGSEPSSAC